MSYRIDQGPMPPGPSRSMQTATTPGHIYITNGDKDRIFAVPCTYTVVERAKRIQDKKMLDEYKKRPSMQSCIIRRLHDDRLQVPIHFNKEYYKINKDNEKEYYKFNVVCHLEKDEDTGELTIPGLAMSGYIDDRQDWVIKLSISANCEKAIQKPETCKYSVIMTNEELGKTKTVLTGKITVLPAIL